MNVPEGITLRDFFAGCALANAYTQDEDAEPHIIAMWAYAIADAMLEHRKEDKEE